MEPTAQDRAGRNKEAWFEKELNESSRDRKSGGHWTEVAEFRLQLEQFPSAGFLICDFKKPPDPELTRFQL